MESWAGEFLMLRKGSAISCPKEHGSKEWVHGYLMDAVEAYKGWVSIVMENDQGDITHVLLPSDEMTGRGYYSDGRY